MKFNPNTRITLIGIVIVTISFIFGMRLFFLQVIKGEEYSTKADKRYVSNAKSFFDRGTIYFKTKDGTLVSAATLKQEYSIIINPKLISSVDTLYKLLKPTIKDLKGQDLADKVSNKGTSYQVVTEGISKIQADEINKLEIKGVYIEKKKSRFYPAGKSASHVLGFMADSKGEYTGIYGLEKSYNKILTHNNSGSFAKFFAEVFLGLTSEITGDVTSGEGDIILTIEPVVQNVVEKRLKGVLDLYKAQSGGVIVMEVKTGKIVAMASLPDFHPGERQKDITYLPNPLVERVFEMGSVIKPLTLAAGINEGVVNSKTTYNDLGSITLDNRTIMNHDKVAHGVVDMQEVINKSLNLGAVFIMQKLGKDKFRQYMFDYGLDDKTEIDLPGEVKSLVGNLNSPRTIEYATASFGQGIALTPISAISAFNVIANGGKLLKPYVVDEVKYDLGTSQKVLPKVLKDNVLTRQTTEEVTQVLINAVDTSLLGGTFSLPNYSVAAKTGTAQMSDGRGGYFEDQYLHSFFGFYPAYNPEFITFMYLVDPRGARYSSDTLTRPFMEIAKFLLNYYEVPPDR